MASYHSARRREYGGNIGYGVRPSERQKGYATKMLALALEEYKKIGMFKVLITCSKSDFELMQEMFKGEFNIQYGYEKKNVPSLEEAKPILKEAEKLNPGPWVEHSLYVGKAAELIAKKDNELNSDTAMVLGMLLDIGRRYGVTDEGHSLDGYKFAMEKGYGLWARICITHGYLCKNAEDVCGKKDCTIEEHNFIKEYLDSIEFSAYDKLIQICDFLVLPSGFCILEKRMVDVVMRYGFNEFTLEKWKIAFEIKRYFEQKIGCSIYSILPNVKEVTFDF